MLSTNPRFQNVVDARGRMVTEQSAEVQRAALLSRLDSAQRRRLAAIEAKCRQVLQIYQDQGVDEFTVTANTDALQRLQWIFLKLLVAQHYLQERAGEVSPARLQLQIEQLQRDLQLTGLTRTLRESKEGTLRILEQRLTNLNRRAESDAEIESDLGRVEAQVDLALESASMQGQAAVISGHVELTSHLLDSTSFGDLSDTVSAMDQSISAARPAPSATAATSASNPGSQATPQ